MSDKRIWFSVIICTRNRSALLGVALETLCTQSLPKADYEVIVVDNHSTDETANVVETFRPRLPNLQVCFEPVLGISVARNHGWRVARGQYVAFMDDDSQAPAEWLATAQQIVAMHAPGAFGGPYFACYSGPKPAWFKDSYGSMQLGERPQTLTGGYLPGSNLFFRRDLLEVTGGFDPTLGVVDQQLGYGEESALLQVLRERCPHELIYYDPKLSIYHLVRPEKMRVRWQLRRHFVTGRYLYRARETAYLRLVGRKQQVKRLLRTLIPLFFTHSRQLIQRDRSRYPYAQNYLVEVIGPELRKVGGMVEQLQQTLTRRIKI